MTKPTAICSLALALACWGCGGPDSGAEEGETEAQEPAGEESAPPLPPDLGTMSMTPRVVLETNRGDIVLELDREAAPQTVANILWHVERGFYDSLTFHRVIPGFMIQGGGYTAELRQRVSPRPPVQNEAKNGGKNVRGTVALARRPDPHSGSTQFFINLVDNPDLDFVDETDRGWGYTVFGRVVEGMDVVDAIAAVQTRTMGPHENVPVEPVVIESAHLAE